MHLFNIPFTIGLTIDDMGWWLCRNDKAQGGPPRLHGTEDPKPVFYNRLFEMGKAAGTRPQGSFIMSEFDCENVCGKPQYNKPLSPIDVTEKGLNWTNCIDEEKKNVLELLKIHNAWFEFGLHGVRHGHFEEGRFYESEWAKRPPRDEKGKFTTAQTQVEPWDEENRTNEVIADCFTDLIREYYTEEELPFPESFAPPHHILYYDKNDRTTGAVLSKRGVKYCNAKISGRVSLESRVPKGGAVDHGMHILDRRSLRGVPFDDAAHTPVVFPRKFPWIETHFRDFWRTETKWAQYLYNINSRRHYMLGKNTEQVHSQYYYNKYAKIINLPGKVIIDTTKIPQEAYDCDLLSSLVLKVPLGPKENITSFTCEGEPHLTGYYKDVYGFGYVTVGSSETMGRLKKGRYVFTYTVSKKAPVIYVDNSMKTYNLYELDNRVNADSESFSVKMRVKVYGTQTVRMALPAQPTGFSGTGVEYDLPDYKEGFFYFRLKAKSLNGSMGEISLIR